MNGVVIVGCSCTLFGRGSRSTKGGGTLVVFVGRPKEKRRAQIKNGSTRLGQAFGNRRRQRRNPEKGRVRHGHGCKQSLACQRHEISCEFFLEEHGFGMIAIAIVCDANVTIIISMRIPNQSMVVRVSFATNQDYEENVGDVVIAAMIVSTNCETILGSCLCLGSVFVR